MLHSASIGMTRIDLTRSSIYHLYFLLGLSSNLNRAVELLKSRATIKSSCCQIVVSIPFSFLRELMDCCFVAVIISSIITHYM